MKDVPGENMGTVVSFLKGALVLIQNCAALPTDTIGLMNSTMCSTNCDKFRVFMPLVYFDHKRSSRPIAPTKYLELAKQKYQTIVLEGEVDRIKVRYIIRILRWKQQR